MCDPPAPPPSSPFDAGPPGRRHSLPPPPGGERADLLLLDEHPPELGMALWQLLRGARLWGAREGHDPTLFDLPGPIDATCRAAADAAPEIAAALAVLLGVLRAPHHAQRAEVAEACRAVLEWATARGAGETAFQAAEIVAVVLPTDARACADAGKACARIGERSRAIAWYQRAIVLARRAGEWRWYVTTLLRHGYALVEVGRLDLAKRMFERAWRTAKRKGMKKEAGYAQHDLFTVGIEEGDWAAALEHAREVMAILPIFAPKFYRFAVDFGFMLQRMGHFGRSRAVLEAVMPLISSPEIQTLATANLALACAYTGDRFQAVALQARLVPAIACEAEFAALALTQSAHIEGVLGHWSEAEAVVAQARALATRRKERTTLELIEEVEQKCAERRLNAAAPPGFDSDELQSLTRSILRRARRQRGRGSNR